MKFEKAAASHPWGVETYEVADLGMADTKVSEGWLAGNTLGDVMETYLDRVTGDLPYAFYGRQFPLSVRRLEANGTMPLQVCPPDEVAEQRFDSLGKAKLWYVVEAEPGAAIVQGFARDVTAEEAYLIATGKGGKKPDGSVFHIIDTHKGDHFTINPGTVHCAFGKLTVLEIAEASAMDITLWNWGEGMDADDLGMVEALDFIELGRHRQDQAQFPDPRQLASQEEFRISKISLTEGLRVFPSEAGLFLLYSCVSGSAAVQTGSYGNAETYSLRNGETILIPAEVKDAVVLPKEAGTVLLEATVGTREEKEEWEK